MPSRGNSLSKGPEAGTGLVFFKAQQGSLCDGGDGRGDGVSRWAGAGVYAQGAPLVALS